MKLPIFFHISNQLGERLGLTLDINTSISNIFGQVEHRLIYRGEVNKTSMVVSAQSGGKKKSGIEIKTSNISLLLRSNGDVVSLDFINSPSDNEIEILRSLDDMLSFGITNWAKSMGYEELIDLLIPEV